jgi:hypothetical protein
VGVSALTWEYHKTTWVLFGLLTAHVYSRRYASVPIDLHHLRSDAEEVDDSDAFYPTIGPAIGPATGGIPAPDAGYPALLLR